MRKLLITSAICAAIFTSPIVANAASNKSVVSNYTNIVYTNYSDSYHDAVALQTTVNAFLAEPTSTKLQAAKKAWLISRDSYGQTESYRFYEGPIDFADEAKGEEGPEGRLNAWPLNEAYIDYVVGNENSGIVQDTNVEITKDSLDAKNQENDEANVSTGYHAIEFLLWGQDLSLDHAGTRPASDYAETPKNKRRRDYLKAVTNLLVDDLKFLVDSWTPNADNYAKKFKNQDEKTSLQNILTALATLSGFELAAERIATALDSGDQEDEHSCFSDNTHNDFIMNAKAVSNVFFGEYGNIKGDSIYDLVKAKNAELAEKIKTQLTKTEKLVTSLPSPIDREVLASLKGSEARATAEALVTSLQTQADLFKAAGKTLGLNVEIVE